MTKELDLIGVCGLFCGACNHYRCSFPDGEHLLPPDLRDESVKKLYQTCLGCRSDMLYGHPGCLGCKIRSCAEERGIDHCGECADLPCAMLVEFQKDGREHHLDILENLDRLKDMGMERWLEDRKMRWTCACGTPFSWYEKHCMKCGKPLESYSE